MDSIRDSVFVITGASSGIGRATALEVARRGGCVVVAARRDLPLADLVDQCVAAGGQALAIPTDVTDPAAVYDLARRAVAAFGRIDVWVNDAAVTCYGPFDETPPEVFRQVIDTNLFGYVNGARAALAQFRLQRRGVLINVGSMLSRLSEPWASAYVTAKHAVRGFSQSLRQELLLEGARDIHVSLVMPATIDTPLFQHSANYLGRTVVAAPPVYPPERVARRIVRLALHPRREVFVGSAARTFTFLSYFVPGLVEKMLARMVNQLHLAHDNVPFKNGNVFTPVPEGADVSGGWKPRGTRRVGRAALVRGAVTAPALAGLYLLRQRRGRRVAH
jgi:NAD(P)-dependent dehydrogenase (short-subunit alcohol dehydrogenase family)